MASSPKTTHLLPLRRALLTSSSSSLSSTSPASGIKSQQSPLSTVPLSSSRSVTPGTNLPIAAPQSSNSTSAIRSHNLLNHNRHFQTSAVQFKMQAQHGHSAACCNVPPVVVEGYQPKGKWVKIGDYNTYVTGSSTATRGLLFIYDIFGKDFSQTIQGADILGTQFQVFMPDYFGDKAADISWYPPDNKDKEQKLGNFFQTVAAPPKAVGIYQDIFAQIQRDFKNVDTWGVVGFCWGGKLVSFLSAGETTPFTAAAECHPAMVDPEDAKKIKIPVALLASGDEPEEDVKKFEQNLEADKHVEIFKDQIHGWMAARSNLKDDRVKSEYERGYKTLLTFFTKTFDTLKASS